jgi:REP-associated tyrosine transposase
MQGKERNFAGERFWARGYEVSTVGFNEEEVRRYIRNQNGSDGSGRFCNPLMASRRCDVKD